MKLPFRGYSYEVPAPIPRGYASKNKSQMKLIYRGEVYNYTPRPVVISGAVEPEGMTVTLIYRGNTYERKLRSPKAYQEPRAINWRYQINPRSS
jgi:Domain of unknown function (DUF4278)